MKFKTIVCCFSLFAIISCSASERSREINFDKLPFDLKGCKFYKLIEKDFGVALVVAKCNNSSMTSTTEITKYQLPTIVITSEM